MNINTNGWTIYAPERTTIDQIIDAFRSDENLWSKVVNSTLNPYRGHDPEEWVRAHSGNAFVYTTGRDKEKIKLWRTKKVTCPCGCDVSNGGLHKHRKTKVHQLRTAQQTKLL